MDTRTEDDEADLHQPVCLLLIRPAGMQDFSSPRGASHFGNGYISCGRKHPRTVYVVDNAFDPLADHLEPDG